jgi:hypothetical protein
LPLEDRVYGTRPANPLHKHLSPLQRDDTIPAKRFHPLQHCPFEASGGRSGRRRWVRQGKTSAGRRCPERPIDHVAQPLTPTIALSRLDCGAQEPNQTQAVDPRGRNSQSPRCAAKTPIHRTETRTNASARTWADQSSFDNGLQSTRRVPERRRNKAVSRKLRWNPIVYDPKSFTNPQIE